MWEKLWEIYTYSLSLIGIHFDEAVRSVGSCGLICAGIVINRMSAHSYLMWLDEL